MKLTDRHRDAAGMSTGRMLRQHVGGRLRPLGCFSHGLEVKHILALAVRQYLGYPIAYLTIRYNRQWQRALAAWRRFRPAPRGDDD